MHYIKLNETGLLTIGQHFFSKNSHRHTMELRVYRAKKSGFVPPEFQRKNVNFVICAKFELQIPK